MESDLPTHTLRVEFPAGSRVERLNLGGGRTHICVCSLEGGPLHGMPRAPVSPPCLHPVSAFLLSFSPPLPLALAMPGLWPPASGGGAQAPWGSPGPQFLSLPCCIGAQLNPWLTELSLPSQGSSLASLPSAPHQPLPVFLLSAEVAGPCLACFQMKKAIKYSSLPLPWEEGKSARAEEREEMKEGVEGPRKG